MHEDFDINPAELCVSNLFPLYRNLLSRNSERLIPLRKVHLPGDMQTQYDVIFVKRNSNL
jgi:hypothetical protein